MFFTRLEVSGAKGGSQRQETGRPLRQVVPPPSFAPHRALYLWQISASDRVGSSANEQPPIGGPPGWGGMLGSYTWKQAAAQSSLVCIRNSQHLKQLVKSDDFAAQSAPFGGPGQEATVWGYPQPPPAQFRAWSPDGSRRETDWERAYSYIPIPSTYPSGSRRVHRPTSAS